MVSDHSGQGHLSRDRRGDGHQTGDGDGPLRFLDGVRCCGRILVSATAFASLQPIVLANAVDATSLTSPIRALRGT